MDKFVGGFKWSITEPIESYGLEKWAQGDVPKMVHNCKNGVFRVFGDFREKLKLPEKL